MDSDILSPLDGDISSVIIPESSESQPSKVLSIQRRGRKSWVWNHTPDLDRNTIHTTHDGKSLWKCSYCTQVYAETSGTTVAIRHLLKAHKITEESSQLRRLKARDLDIAQAFARGSLNTSKRRCLSSIATETLEPEVIEQLYVRLIVCCSLSFRLVEREEFRSFLQYLNPEIGNWLPSSHTTIRVWIIRTFNAEKLLIQQAIHSALSKIHFTVDLWTSPNSLAILGIIGHYMAENGDLQQSVLALVELDGQHTGQSSPIALFH
jgi:uncharacterized C2H2 Zn-finger protein